MKLCERYSNSIIRVEILYTRVRQQMYVQHLPQLTAVFNFYFARLVEEHAVPDSGSEYVDVIRPRRSKSVTRHERRPFGFCAS